MNKNISTGTCISILQFYENILWYTSTGSTGTNKYFYNKVMMFDAGFYWYSYVYRL